MIQGDLTQGAISWEYRKQLTFALFTTKVQYMTLSVTDKKRLYNRHTDSS